MASATVVAQTTYTVGGTGANFPTLEALRTSGVLKDGDTIILNRNDSSLTAPFTNTLAFQGTGTISSRFFDNSSKDVTLDSNSLGISGRASIVARNVDIIAGTNTFSDNNGAISGNTTITGGTNTFSNNQRGPNIGGAGGAISGNTTLAGGINTFSGNSAAFGGAIRGNVDITGGTNTFSNNTAPRNATGGGGYGGAVYGTVNISGGTNTFADNISGTTGAIDGITTITDGANTFSRNGTAIYGNATITGGTNIFSDNSRAALGGQASWHTITGGTNTFSGNGGGINGYTNITGGMNTFTNNDNSATVQTNGGAISDGVSTSSNTTITGGTNTFLSNKARGNGGAIYTGGNGIFRATDGDFTFQGNRDGVGTTSEKANAMYVSGNILTLAAEAGQSVYFYDPVTTSNSTSRTININNQSTDTGAVVFDGSGYGRAVDRFSNVYGNTTVGHGLLSLQGDVTYGAARNVGTFTLNEWATLSIDATTNRIQANRITMNGTVDIARGGTLELGADAGVYFGGTMNVGLGMDSSGYMDTLGSFTRFENGAMMSLYWDDNLTALYDGWTNEYSLFGSFNVFGLDNLILDMSAFNAYEGFSWTWNNSILTLTYNDTTAIPEPATLAVLGLGLTGLAIARRRRGK